MIPKSGYRFSERSCSTKILAAEPPESAGTGMWLPGVNLMKRYRVIGSALVSSDRSSPMRQFILATHAFAAIAAATPSAHAAMVGGAAGAGVGLVVAGPVGAVAGGVV